MAAQTTAAEMAAQATAAEEAATPQTDGGANYAAERQAAKHKFQQGEYEDAIKIWTGCLAHGCDAATLLSLIHI